MAKSIFLETLEASKPSKLIAKSVSAGEQSVTIEQDHWQIERKELIYVIAVGKASQAMAESLRKVLVLSKNNVLFITPSADAKEEYCISSSHPIPDQSSEQAAQKLIHFIENISAWGMVLFALSGGTSALICKPAKGLHLRTINKMNELLLESGANIKEINTVRKHLSAIKGGQLLSYFHPNCTLIDLVISDVPGDDLQIIGSGPTTPDSSTFQDAYDTLLRYDLWKQSPEAVRSQIKKGLTGEVPETVKPGHDPIEKHKSYIIGSARKFAEKAAERAQKKGFNTWIAAESYNDSVEQVADGIAKRIDEKKRESDHPTALIFYGESTVQVRGEGKGGRNQELALRGAQQIKGMKDIVWLSAGTDGIDGPTDAAGAIVNEGTIQKAEKKGLDINKFLKNNDSYHFHEQMGTLLKTGPTGNNVMDIVLILINQK